MPTIPDAPSLGQRAIPQSQRPMADLDVSQMAKATAGFGQDVAQAGMYGLRIDAQQKEEAEREAEKQRRDADDLALSKASLIKKQGFAEAQQFVLENPDKRDTYEELGKQIIAKRTEEANAIVPEYLKEKFGIYSQEVDLNFSTYAKEKQLQDYGQAEITHHGYQVEAARKRAQSPTATLGAVMSDVEALTRYAKTVKGVSEPQKRALEESTKQVWEDYVDSLPPDEALKLIGGAAGVGSGYDSVMRLIEQNEVSGASPDIINKDGKNKKGEMTFAYRGINSDANPEEFRQIQALLDAGKTTEARAIADRVYKEKYWDAIDGDSIPANAQAIIMDAAVNQGVSYANMLKEKLADGATPSDLIQMRRERYARTSGTADEKASWESRLKKLEGEAQYTSVIPADVVSKKLPQIRARAEKDRVEAVKQNLLAVENGVDVPPIPASSFPSASEYNDYYVRREGAVTINRYRLMPPSEIGKDVAASAPVGQDNIEAASAVFKAKREAAERVMKERAADPQRAALDANPDVLNLFVAAENAKPEDRPAIMQSAIAKSIETQRNLGVEFPRVTSKVDADNWSARIEAASSRGAEQTLQELRAMSDLYGDQYYSQAVGEIMPKMQSPARFAAFLYNPLSSAQQQADSQAMAIDALGLSKATIEDLSKAVPSESATTIKDGVMEKTLPLYKTLAGTNSGEGQKVYSDILEQAQKLALHYSATRGLQPSEAVTMATNAVMSKYSFVDSYRIPARFIPDEGAITLGADAFVKKLTSKDVEIPSAYVSGDDYVLALKTGAQWVTNEGETGLFLRDQNQREIRDKDGKRIEKPFQWFIKAGSGFDASVKAMQDIGGPFLNIGVDVITARQKALKYVLGM